jgi:site-specific DNA-methyltransferase (adenine-specific)
VNPPYSQKLKEQFVIKGIEEMKKGNTSVFLIPVSTSTKLFHDYIKPNASEIRFVKGRIKFGKRDENGNFYLPLNSKGKTQSGTKDSMIVIFK